MNPAYIYSKTLIPPPFSPVPTPQPPSPAGRNLLRRLWGTASSRRPSSGEDELAPAGGPPWRSRSVPSCRRPSRVRPSRRRRAASSPARPSPLPTDRCPLSPGLAAVVLGGGSGGELGRRGVEAGSRGGGGGGGAGGGCRGGGLRGLVCSQARPQSDVIDLCVFIDLICLYVMD
jgi:hypothetical protein